MGIMLFVASLMPLFVFVGILYYDIQYLLVTSITLTILSILIMLFVMVQIHLHRKKNANSGECNEIRNIKIKRSLPIDFLYVYILPLMAFNLNETTNVVCLILVVLIYALLYIRNGMYSTNICFFIIGYKAYSGELNGEDVTIIKFGKWSNMQAVKASCIFLSKDSLIVTNLHT